jgi:alpha-mannosidase
MSDTVGRVPRIHSGGTVDDFFDRLEKKASSLVTWYGELYFELHQGVYTTQANTKINNRKSEFLLRDIELLATIASIQDSTYQYPKVELDKMWEGVLLCQFHDCLPGSAIKMCYDDSDRVRVLVHEGTPNRTNCLSRYTPTSTKPDTTFYSKPTRSSVSTILKPIQSVAAKMLWL